ncbi:saccharopine dehydrogenase family protein [Brevibacillus borstelensis]|jgi:saccharopine dehydrogenase-like NADP-dependent oxidoreductase|uniref:saccharopine dehydrogenase family protein n=1 Tax=Brevibacillus borstelensis TaxID=45462 RepID=UPI00203F7235|nr:saccharopine dehydrogenase C-terminal domain-containing protein [Brevibacillus borstelensis]MCM3593026.1 saccharopine dehydrogenase NADP-binding domain-containing protein [Brevibacillus borstelensis]
MKVLCLGGAGRICRESILDLVQYSSFEKITVADFNEEEGRKVVEWLNDPRVDFVKINVLDHEDTVNKMKGYDIVMDGTTITLNGLSTACIAEAGCHGINLNGFGAEDESDEVFRRNGKTCVPGFGMTPGVTQMMAMHAANQLDTVDSVRVSHGAFRPIAFSRSITETTTYEYAPHLPGRVVYENGEFVQVPPFARPREIQLPEPYGKTVQYIIPHAETKTLAKALADKQVRLIEVRGTWPAKNMQLVRAMYDWGIMRNDKITVNGAEIGILDCIGEYLFHSKEGQETELYGYSLHVEVIGTKDGKKVQHVLYHTHPASDGSVPGWEKLRAYTRNVGIPMAIATELIAKGRVKGTGVLIPEEAFNPAEIFAELEKRGIHMHEEVTQLGAENESMSVIL